MYKNMQIDAHCLSTMLLLFSQANFLAKSTAPIAPSPLGPLRPNGLGKPAGNAACQEIPMNGSAAN